MDKKERKELKRLQKKVDEVYLDLGETLTGNDLDHQRQKLKKVSEDMGTMVHGSGTGEE